MLHPLLRTLVKFAVASLVMGTVLAHFGITVDQLMRTTGLSADRLEDYARKGLAWAERAARLAGDRADLVPDHSVPSARPEAQRIT